MEKDQLLRKLAVILHADVVGSTTLVQKDEALAHERIQSAFNNFSETINTYGGNTRELRGDALVAEFARASDAVSAALLFQQNNEARNKQIDDDIIPNLRVGISLGEVIFADGTVTGEGIVLAQRLEQLAEAGGVVVQGTVSETVPSRLGFQFETLGEVQLKGFDLPIRAFVARLDDGATIPQPEPAAITVKSDKTTLSANATTWLSVAALITVGGFFAWNASNDEGDSELASLPPGPRIAVMSFEPGDPFSHGLTEDLIESLTKFSSMLVFPTVATTKLQKEGADCASIREALGATFILNGTVRQQQSKLRVNVNLVNALDCSQLWSKKFDRNMTVSDLFAMTDEVVFTIASLTGSTTSGYETLADIIRTNNPNDLDVYDCVLKADWYYQHWVSDYHKEARDCLEWAVEQDPNYAKAKTALANIYIDEVKNGLPHRYPDSLERAERLLQVADKITPNSDDVHYSKAMLAFYSAECGDYDKFYAAAEKAFELNPNNFLVVGDIGNHAGYSGNFERGIELLERAKKLNPNYADSDWVYFLPMLNSYRTGDFPMAVSYYQKMPRTGNHYMVKTILAATYGRQGKKDKAIEVLALLTENFPQFVEDPRQPFLQRRMDPVLIESIMEGLRTVGYNVPPKPDSGKC